MKYIRVAGLFTASGLMALLVAILFGQATTSSPSIPQPAAANQTPSSATATPQDATANALEPDLDAVRALRQVGLTDAAMSELRRWVQKHPKEAIPTDIKEWLASLDDNALDVARANRDAGLLDAARASLQLWIKQHPKNSVPKDLADLLPGPIDNSLQLARAYKKTNSLEAAAAELQKWIQRHPESPVPADLEDLLPGQFDALLWKVRHSLGPWIGPVLKGLGVLVLLFLVLLRMTHLVRPFLVIGDFESSGSDATLGKRIATLVRQNLAEPRSARSSLTIASGPVEPIQVPAEITSGLSSAVPMAQTVTALLRWVSPRQVVTITGLLHPQGLRGVGVTLTIAENQRASHSATLWQRDFEPDFAPVPVGTDGALATQAFDLLIAPSATWVQFQMQKVYGSSKKISFQTRDWRSQTAFDAGLRLTDLGRSGAAQIMYLRALAHDPKNFAAQLNLALLLPSSEISEQVKQLEYVATKTKGQTYDSTYYSAAFSLATVLTDLGKNKEASNIAKELTNQITKDLAKFDRTGIRKFFKSTDNSAQEKYLRVIAPSARVIAAALASEPLPSDVDQLWPSTEFQYNLACYYSMLGKDLVSSLEHLEFAASLNRSKVVSQAATDRNTVLSNVSNSPDTSARFAEIITPIEPPVAPAAPSVLASLIVIGLERAAMLVSNGVVSPADLILKCTTFTAASAVAASVGVKLDTMLRWARVAELTRLPNIQPSHINALTLGGLDSLAALREVMPAKIAAVLQDWRSDAPAPSADTIGAWALEIMNTSSVVFRTQN
jgi:tetratricopeptide (TPR) repeat protein